MKQAETHESDREAPIGARNRSAHQSLIRPFGQALPVKFLRAREVMVSRMRPVLQARRITDQQWRILRTLAELGEAEILVLSEWCTIQPASLSRILPKMEAAGLITRQTNAADKRRVNVRLSENGWALYESILPEYDVVYQGIVDAIGLERLDDLNRIVDGIIEALKQSQGGRHF